MNIYMHHTIIATMPFLHVVLLFIDHWTDILFDTNPLSSFIIHCIRSYWHSARLILFYFILFIHSQLTLISVDFRLVPIHSFFDSLIDSLIFKFQFEHHCHSNLFQSVLALHCSTCTCTCTCSVGYQNSKQLLDPISLFTLHRSESNPILIPFSKITHYPPFSNNIIYDHLILINPDTPDSSPHVQLWVLTGIICIPRCLAFIALQRILETFVNGPWMTFVGDAFGLFHAC